MDLEDLIQIIKEEIKTHPELREELIEIYRNVEEECDSGGSEYNEVEQAFEEIKQLKEEVGK